jgi:TonB family protein
MNSLADPALLKESLVEEVVCLALGALVTLGLFLGLSHFQREVPPAPPVAVEDLRAVSIPLEPPPPPPNPAYQNESPAPLAFSTGLEASPADSPVKIAVGPLAFDLPAIPVDVPADVHIARVYPEFKPGADLSVSEQHIYQEVDVDQLPRATKRSLQFIPPALRVNLTQIRVVLLILMERNGKAGSVRIVKSCGVPALDQIVVRSVREDWEFSPAVKRGKPVRCLVQQAILIKMLPGSLLEAY